MPVASHLYRTRLFYRVFANAPSSHIFLGLLPFVDDRSSVPEVGCEPTTKFPAGLPYRDRCIPEMRRSAGEKTNDIHVPYMYRLLEFVSGCDHTCGVLRASHGMV